MRFLYVSLVVVSIFVGGLILLFPNKQMPIQVYKGTEGVKIISYSENWSNEKKLKEVYSELLNNFHAEELGYLEGIYLLPQKEEVAAYYFSDYDVKDGSIVIGKEARIEIYNMDRYNNVKDIARIIAHEYGHHFTTFYLLGKEGKLHDQWNQTEYAKIRKFYLYPLVKSYEDKIDPNNHRWDISEIAAEDYVQLFGSPLARKTIDYKDIEERLEEGIYHYSYKNNDFNLLPQENLELPLAPDVEGLYTYWYTIATNELPNQVPLQLSITQLIITKNQKVKGYNNYQLNWSAVNQATNYTLIMFPKEDSSFPEPIKRVEDGNELTAIIGCGIKNFRDGTIKAFYRELQGTYCFILFAEDQQGFIHQVANKEIHFK